MESFLFYFFSLLSVLSALGAIIARQPARALLSLILTMFSLAVLFILLGAYFVAMAHLIIYAGAVLVLFLFVIMLQGLGAKDSPLPKRFHAAYLLTVSFVGVCFLALFLFLISAWILPVPRSVQGTVEEVGKVLFRDFLLPFELTSVLLLLGVFAAVALAKKEEA